MKKILICLIVYLAFFISAVNAQNNTSEEYIIKKDDTLWDISNTKLEDPFLWPKLWSVNSQINNPDLIYPGSKIIIPSREKLMRMLPPEPTRKIPATLKPKKIETKPVFMFPEKEIQKYIVNKDFYIASGWISAEFPGIGEIAYSPMNRQIVGTNDIVYLKYSDEKTLSSNGEEANKKFFAIRDIKEVKHPVTGNILGHQIRITGILEIIETDNNMPKAKITKSFEEIQIGDGLLPFKEMTPPLIPDIIRTPDIQGYIVESHMNSQILGKGDIVFLDKGQDHGLEIGDVFSAFSELPVERTIGTVQIISLQPTTSTAIILSSNQEILIGTRWGNK